MERAVPPRRAPVERRVERADASLVLDADEVPAEVDAFAEEEGELEEMEEAALDATAEVEEGELAREEGELDCEKAGGVEPDEDPLTKVSLSL